MMKCLLLVLLFPCLIGAEGRANGIRFETGLNWSQVKEKAKKERKYIFLDFYTTWCGPCRKMDQEVYSDHAVMYYMNANFVSVKVQCDRTEEDDAFVKAWYAEAQELKKTFSIAGYPTLIFMNPDGLLLARKEGYRDIGGFLKIAKDVMDSELLQQYNYLEMYKQGIRNYEQMPALALFLRNVLKQKNLADEIAEEYSKKVLATMRFDSLLTEERVKLIVAFPKVVRSTDSFFFLCRNHPEKVDSIMKRAGWTKSFMVAVINREELDSKLLNNEKPVNKEDPDWRVLKVILEKKYDGIVDVNKLLLDYQINYYRNHNLNWHKWSEYKQLKMKSYPQVLNDRLGILRELNDGGAWDVFLHCNDEKVLKRGLDWIDTCMDRYSKLSPGNFSFSLLDTKANLLYKLGYVKQAVEYMNEAIQDYKNYCVLNHIDISTSKQPPLLNGFFKTIEEMRRGEPTCLDQGAIWDMSKTTR